MKHKRPVRGNCWVITIIYSLHFNFERYFFNNKGAGIISKPGEGRERGPPGAAAPRALTALCWRLQYLQTDQRRWHLSGRRLPIPSQGQRMGTQHRRSVVVKGGELGRSVVRAQA